MWGGKPHEFHSIGHIFMHMLTFTYLLKNLLWSRLKYLIRKRFRRRTVRSYHFILSNNSNNKVSRITWSSCFRTCLAGGTLKLFSCSLTAPSNQNNQQTRACHPTTETPEAICHKLPCPAFTNGGLLIHSLQRTSSGDLSKRDLQERWTGLAEQP